MKDTAKRFWSKVAVGAADECWPWLAGCNRKTGRGQSSLAGQSMPAPRVAWILTFGPIPEGQDVLHTCDNPPCVNPVHLFLGTDVDNAQDAIRKGRRVGFSGGTVTRAIRVPIDVAAYIDAEARRQNKTVSAVLRDYLTGWIAGWADAQARLREALKGA
jgi:HNH endonuclease